MAILFLWNFIPTKKFLGDLLFICQSSSARESKTSHYASDGPKKAGGIVGGVKDDGEMFDC